MTRPHARKLASRCVWINRVALGFFRELCPEAERSQMPTEMPTSNMEHLTLRVGRASRGGGRRINVRLSARDPLHSCHRRPDTSPSLLAPRVRSARHINIYTTSHSSSRLLKPHAPLSFSARARHGNTGPARASACNHMNHDYARPPVCKTTASFCPPTDPVPSISP